MRNKIYLALSVIVMLLSGCVNNPGDAEDGYILDLSQQRFNIGADGGQITVSITHRVDIRTVIAADSRHWISETASDNQKTITTKTFTIKPNLTTTAREGKVTFSTGLKEKEILVSQAGSKPKLPGELVSFRFEKDRNPSLSRDVEMTIMSNNIIYGYLPNNAGITSLIPTFVINNGTLSVSNAQQYSGQSAQDFTSPVSYLMTGENDAKVMFSVHLFDYTGLPVMVVTTETARSIDQTITNKEDYIQAQVRIDGMGQFDGYTGTVSLHGAGNASWSLPKKCIDMTLSDAVSLLGMPKHKNWYMQANWRDRTLLRNDVSFYIGTKADKLAWTPRSQFVEVIFNGRHAGNYQITEQVLADANRVNIAQMALGDISGDNLTGGYLIEVDNYYDKDPKFRTTLYNMPVIIKNPGADNSITPPSQQTEYIENYINELEAALKAGDYATVYQYLDKDSFIDYWIVNALVGNTDPAKSASTAAGPFNVYCYKDRDGKLCAGPLWGFDFSTFATTEDNYKGKSNIHTGSWWYKELFADPEFREAVKARFAVLKSRFQTIPKYIDTRAAYMAKSDAQNWKVWPIDLAKLYSNVNGDEQMTYPDAVARMKQMYNGRLAMLETLINGL